MTTKYFVMLMIMLISTVARAIERLCEDPEAALNDLACRRAAIIAISP